MNDELQRARLYLMLDEDEMANVRATIAQAERRRAAIAYGDCGSPVTFVPVQCSGCDIKLTSQNHAGGRQCLRCEEEAPTQDRQPKPEPIGWPVVILWGVVGVLAVGTAALLVWSL